MSNDEYLRKTTQDHFRVDPSMPKLSEHQLPDYHNRQVVNAEIERLRREREQQGR